MKNLSILFVLISVLGFSQNDSLNQKKDSVLLNLTGKSELIFNYLPSQSSESQRLFRPGVPSLDLRNGNPLFVINGIVKEEIYSIEEVDQDQIIKITELKGAAATALYGSKARNGVYIIETKNSDNSSISDKLKNQIPRIGITSNKPLEIIPIDSIHIPAKQKFPGTVCQGSIKNTTKPNIVVDGELVSEEFIRNLDPNSIESVQVIKNADEAFSHINLNGTIVIQTKSSYEYAEYDLAVLDLGYESFLAMQPSAGTYSLNYLKNKNQRYVTIWNSRVISENPEIYEMPIDYDNRIYYGLDFEYKLFMFFKFMEDKHQISMV